MAGNSFYDGSRKINMPDYTGIGKVNLDWQTAQEVERNWPFVLTLGQGLGLSDTDLDDLFELAATL
jgi:hypothetical protein